MKTFKEYAKEKGIGYEAVRKKVAKYSNELNGHILKNGNSRCLDDYAVDFLDKLNGEEVVIYNVPKDDEILKLKQQNELLQAELYKMQNRLLESNERERGLLKELNSEKDKVLLLTQENTKLLIEAKPKSLWERLFGGKHGQQNAQDAPKTDDTEKGGESSAEN